MSGRHAPQCCWSLAALQPFLTLLQLQFRVIRKLVAGMPDHFHPVVFVRIGGRDHDAGHNEPVLVRYAIPGVVMIPANRAATPDRRNPPAMYSASHGPLSRVSIPITTSRMSAFLWVRAQLPRATPSPNAVRLSNGGWPATPRIPSVPKYFLAKNTPQKENRRKPLAPVYVRKASSEQNGLQSSEF